MNKQTTALVIAPTTIFRVNCGPELAPKLLAPAVCRVDREEIPGVEGTASPTTLVALPPLPESITIAGEGVINAVAPRWPAAFP